MRVLVLGQSYAPVFEGGTERVARARVRALVEAGHHVRVIAAAPPAHGVFEGAPEPPGSERGERGQASAEQRVDGVPVVFIAEDFPPGDRAQLVAQRLWIDRPTRRAAVLAQVAAWTQAEGAFDLVLVEHLASLSLGLVAALRQRGARVVLALHDLFVTCPRFFRDPPSALDLACPGPGDALTACAHCIAPEAPEASHAELLAAMGERQRRFALELDGADLVIAPSQSHAARIEALLGRAPGSVAVVPNGLVGAIPEVVPAPRAAGPLRILHFGHRVRTKGVVELVRAAGLAARQLVEEGAPAPVLTLALFGAPLEADLDAELERLAAGFPGLALELNGAYAIEALAQAAARADVAAFPSKALESYGLVVDEALALGLPVLVADTGDGRTPGALAERVAEAGAVLPRPTGAAAIEAWAAALADLARERVAGQSARLDAWRAAIPPRMPGPADAVAHLLRLLDSPPAP